MTLSLTVFNKGNGSSDAALAIPLTPGVSTPSLTLALNTEATRVARLSFQRSVNDIQQAKACGLLGKGRDRLPLRLHGDLGIKQWLDRIVHVQTTAKVAPGELRQIDYDVEFKIEKTLTPSLRLTLIPVGTRTMAGGGRLELLARYTHKLALVLTKRPSGSPPPTRVVIVGYDIDEKKRRVDGAARKRLADLEKERKRIETAIQDVKERKSLHWQGVSPETQRAEIERLERRQAQIVRQQRSLRGYLARSQETQKKGLSEREKRDLDDAVTRSILRGIQDELSR
ncbi:MAG: hypothetical protein AB7E70_17105 [Hyphomicrobiaceae bacterium]